jgi:arylsulfatase A-like enzyme
VGNQNILLVQDFYQWEVPEDHNPPTDRQPPPRETKNEEPLDVVLFYAGHWTMKVLGKLDSDALTPNIDRMADNGVLFSNNCVTTSVRWISRASLMMGVYSSRHLELEPISHNSMSTVETGWIV